MLTLDDLGTVLVETVDVSAKWDRLGFKLNVRVDTIESIRIQFSYSRDRFREMLKVWLTTSDNTSWRTLTDALKSAIVGSSQLADDLERKYCLEETRVDIGTANLRLMSHPPLSPVATV